MDQPISGNRNPDKDKRGETRVPIQTGVTIEFLSATETWRPSVQVGHSIDVSLRGTKVFLGELPTAIYNRLLHDYRRVLVTFNEPETNSQIQIAGQIIWIDYHKNKAGEASGPCYLGVFFEDVKSKDVARYQKLIDALQA